MSSFSLLFSRSLPLCDEYGDDSFFIYWLITKFHLKKQTNEQTKRAQIFATIDAIIKFENMYQSILVEVPPSAWIPPLPLLLFLLPLRQEKLRHLN